MKAVALVGTILFAALIASPADAARHRKADIKQKAFICAGCIDYGEAAELSARRHHYRSHLDASGNVASGIVVSHKTGAKAHVGSAYAARFQALVDAFEAEGATIYSIGGWRPGHCSSASQHPCNKALDVCQTGYGVTLAKCHLPNRARQNQIARNVGLYSGGEWCHPDTGHFQVDQSAAACGGGSTMIASAHRHQRRHQRTMIATYYAPQPASDYYMRAREFAH